MKCVKCKTLLFLDRENKKGEKEYYCIGCGLRGTIEEMTRQKEASDIIFETTISRVTCAVCGKKIRTSEAKIIPRGISQAYVCLTHTEKRLQ